MCPAARIPVYIPTNGVQGFQFLHIPISTCYFLLFFFTSGRSNVCGVLSHVVLICICLIIVTLTILKYVVGHLCIIFGEVFIQVFACFLIRLFFVDVVILYVFRISVAFLPDV